MPKMYDELAEWWPLLSPPEEYIEEASVYREVISSHAAPPPRTLLELGSGGGHNASHLKEAFEMTLVDRAEAMLRQSRQLNPEATHVLGDMREVRLGKQFDAVFVHDAISYMASRDDLLLAMTTAYAHCKPGGVALFVPDETKERFVSSTSSGGSDDGVRGFRYLEWIWDPDPSDEQCVADYAFLIRESNGEVRAVHDRHIHGLFPHQVWLDTLRAAGFEPRSELRRYSEMPDGHELFIGMKR